MVEKNKLKEQAKLRRAYFNMNLGTRNMKSTKDYSRKNKKQIIRKELASY